MPERPIQDQTEILCIRWDDAVGAVVFSELPPAATGASVLFLAGVGAGVMTGVRVGACAKTL